MSDETNYSSYNDNDDYNNNKSSVKFPKVAVVVDAPSLERARPRSAYAAFTCNVVNRLAKGYTAYVRFMEDYEDVYSSCIVANGETKPLKVLWTSYPYGADTMRDAHLTEWVGRDLFGDGELYIVTTGTSPPAKRNTWAWFGDVVDGCQTPPLNDTNERSNLGRTLFGLPLVAVACVVIPSRADTLILSGDGSDASPFTVELRNESITRCRLCCW